MLTRVVFSVGESGSQNSLFGSVIPFTFNSRLMVSLPGRILAFHKILAFGISSTDDCIMLREFLP